MENKTLKATRYEIEQQLNQYIGNIKVEDLSTDSKLALVKLKIELSKVISEIEEFRKKTIDSIEKPDNFDELRENAQKEGATKEDKEIWEKVEKEFNDKFVEIALPYFNEVVELPFDYISEEDFYTLVKHNDANLIFFF